MSYATNTQLETLYAMLQYCRPHGSKAERKFINRFILPLGVEQCGYETPNLIKVIGDNPTVMWSCHVDSVHVQQGRQHIYIDKDDIVGAVKSSCLGADDAAGVWLMHEMIRAGKEGVYVFHRAEEVGGRGSSYLASKEAHRFTSVKACVALDRANYTDVITHQGGSRCCSDEFARSLASELGMGFKPDDSGIFTDSANYTDVIGECTNLSVGYFNAHSPSEQLDTAFLRDLLDALLDLNVNNLAITRTPGEVEVFEYGGIWKGYATGKRWTDYYEDSFWDDWSPSTKRGNYHELREAILDHVDVVADLLDGDGITADDIRQLARGR